MEWNIIKLQLTPSTNTYLGALDEVEEQHEGCVVVTHTQSAGRGQRGNSWEAAPGQNLTFSYLLRPVAIAPQEQFILSQAVSLAMVDVLSRHADGFSVKWPNDIYYRDSKIAGILIEHNLAGGGIARSIVGVGLNVNQIEFESDAPNPVSLAQITGREYDLEQLLDELLQATRYRYAMCMDAPDRLRAEYKQNLYRREGIHTYSDINGQFQAAIEEIEPTGHLLLRDTDGLLRRYAFKEVAFVL